MSNTKDGYTFIPFSLGAKADELNEMAKEVVVKRKTQPRSDFVQEAMEEVKSHPFVRESALDSQVGGDHYKLAIQPIEFITKNCLDFIQGNIVKYATRHKTKNGVEDLKKVIHYAQLAAKLQYDVDL